EDGLDEFVVFPKSRTRAFCGEGSLPARGRLGRAGTNFRTDTTYMAIGVPHAQNRRVRDFRKGSRELSMPGKVMKIGSFSDWIGLFKEWREEIGVNHNDIRNFKFDTLYGAIETNEITFGYYKGRNKWENVRQIPTQNMRDALMNLIVYQGDTEFASVEQQRWLFETAPTDWDRSALTRVMIEEMRHGWQMCALLIGFFGETGKVEAKKMLERRAYEN